MEKLEELKPNTAVKGIIPHIDMKESDEHYILGLCDQILGLKSARQHRFDFLLGDPGRHGRRTKLPVDAYYRELCLVVEYRERQHTETVSFFDKPDRLTCSGFDRRQQRIIYDQRRRDGLSQHGIALVEINYSSFLCTAQKRLSRSRSKDEAVLRGLLSEFIPKGRRETLPEYEVSTSLISQLTPRELGECLALLKEGKAVDLASAKRELPRVQILAIARTGGQIIGVGAIKRIRRVYAETVARRAKFDFPSDTPELGYVARSGEFKGLSLSNPLVEALLEKFNGPLFATTTKDKMKETLTAHGFVARGKEWLNEDSGKLSLWLKVAPADSRRKLG